MIVDTAVVCIRIDVRGTAEDIASHFSIVVVILGLGLGLGLGLRL